MDAAFERWRAAYCPQTVEPRNGAEAVEAHLHADERSIPRRCPERRVWTLLHDWTLVPGVRRVDRLGLVVCDVPWLPGAKPVRA